MALEQTKGKIKLVGKVVGIGNENAVREGFTKSDALYKSLSFFVQTSETNRIRVEMFGMEREHVYAYSQKDQKSKKIAWAKRFDNHGDYKVMGIQAKLEAGKDGKYTRKVLPEFDAVDYIIENLSDGDSVRIIGEIDFQEFENSEGKMTQSTKFIIKSISKLEKEIDFEAEDFKEEAIFEQEIVVVDKEIDKETNKLVIDAKIIKYGEEVVDTSFVVDAGQPKLAKLANNMVKRFSYGDFIKVFGLIKNETILVEDDSAENTTGDDDDWGGDNSIQDEFNKNYVRDYVNELQITSVDTSRYEAKKYKEEDFESEDEDAFNGDIEDEDADPFADDNNTIDIDDDDLPF